MSEPVQLCTHVKVDGVVCGSPAVSGTELCYHHSAVKTALGKVRPLSQVAYGEFNPIPFVFPEDRASMQINLFLLMQAISEQRVERRPAELLLRILKEMGRNLGKSGSLVEEREQGPGSEDQKSGGGEVASSRAHKQPAATEEAGESRVKEGGIVSLTAAAAGLSPEACFSKSGSAGARPQTVPTYMGVDARREMGCLSAAGQRVLELYYRPVER